MKKVIFNCGIGFPSAIQSTEVEFNDNYTEEEITEELWNWAQQFLEAWIEEVDEEEE